MSIAENLIKSANSPTNPAMLYEDHWGGPFKEADRRLDASSSPPPKRREIGRAVFEQLVPGIIDGDILPDTRFGIGDSFFVEDYKPGTIIRINSEYLTNDASGKRIVLPLALCRVESEDTPTEKPKEHKPFLHRTIFKLSEHSPDAPPDENWRYVFYDWMGIILPESDSSTMVYSFDAARVGTQSLLKFYKPKPLGFDWTGLPANVLPNEKNRRSIVGTTTVSRVTKTRKKQRTTHELLERINLLDIYDAGVDLMAKEQKSRLRNIARVAGL